MGNFYVGLERPVIESPCRTPGTIYETRIGRQRILLDISLPVPLVDAESHAEQRRLAAEFHAAVLPVIETIFRVQWSRVAGKKLRGHKEPMPESWIDL